MGRNNIAQSFKYGKGQKSTNVLPRVLKIEGVLFIADGCGASLLMHILMRPMSSRYHKLQVSHLSQAVSLATNL